MKTQKTVVTCCWFAFLLTLLFMVTVPVSCGTKKEFTSITKVKDSTWVKKTIKPVDTTIVIPADHARIAIDWASLGDGKSFKSKSKTGNLTATLSRVGDTIIANCDREELEKIIRLQNELLEFYKLKEVQKSEAKTVTKYRLNWYWIPLIVIGVISVLGLFFGILSSHFKRQ